LLGIKNAAEYEERLITQKEATEAVKDPKDSWNGQRSF